MAQQQTARPAGQLLTVGERLKLARERAGLTVQDFATLVGRHRNTIPRWEARFADPGLPVLRLYVEHCGNTTLEWLMFEIGDWPPLVVNPEAPDPAPVTTGSWAPRGSNPEPTGQQHIIPMFTTRELDQAA